MTGRAKQLHLPCRQSGAALIVSLVLLAILTILGVASMQQGTLQERMTGSVRNKTIALQSAEAALRGAEAWLEATAVPGPFDNSNGLYQPTDPDQPPRWEVVNWNEWDQAAPSGVRTEAVSNVAANPRYIIERLPGIPFDGPQLAGDEPMPGGVVYRVTARGTGLAGQADAMVQSTFRRD